MSGKQMTIVCATDFSQPAAAALKLSAQLATKLGDRVLVVHVVETPTLLAENAPPTGWEAALREAGDVELAKIALALEAEGVESATQLLFGSARDRLLELASEPGVRLLVLGTHGRKGAAHFFLGSVAESVARRAPCPVVATRGLPFPDGGLSGERRMHLLVPIDGTPASEAALGWVKQFRRSVACDVTFFQMFWPPLEAARLGVGHPWVRNSAAPEIIRFLERELRRWVGDLPGEGDVRCCFGVLRERPSELLGTEAELLQPDLVVVGVSNRGGASNGAFTPATVLQAVRTPVACVPEQLRPTAEARIPWVAQVLVGTDLSDSANQATAAAYALLRGTGGSVTICHVVDKDVTPASRLHIERKLAHLAPPEAAGLGISTRVKVVEASSPVTGLMQEAERLGADVVVLSSHGRSGVRRVMMGSVSERMARECGRPLMILHPPQG